MRNSYLTMQLLECTNQKSLEQETLIAGLRAVCTLKIERTRGRDWWQVSTEHYLWTEWRQGEMVQWAREEVKTGLPSTGTAVTFCHWYVYTEWDTALQNANKFSFHMLGGLLGQTSTTEEVHNGLSSTLCTALMAALTRLQLKCILVVAPASLLLSHNSHSRHQCNSNVCHQCQPPCLVHNVNIKYQSWP